MGVYRNELDLLCNTTKYEPYLISGKQYKGDILDDIHYVIIFPNLKYKVVERADFEIVKHCGCDVAEPLEVTTFESIANECLSIYKKKNSDYGSSTTKTYKQFGDISYATRINDKINRINSLLTGNKQQVQDESIDDTIMDLINYGILWMVDRRNSR